MILPFVDPVVLAFGDNLLLCGLEPITSSCFCWLFFIRDLLLVLSFLSEFLWIILLRLAIFALIMKLSPRLHLLDCLSLGVFSTIIAL